MAVGEYLNAGAYDNHLRSIRKSLAANIASMSKTVTETFPEGTRISRPEGGFALWVELPDRVNTRELFNLAIKHEICFAPGDLFTTGNEYGSCMRLSCGFPVNSKTERSVWKLAELIKSMNG